MKLEEVLPHLRNGGKVKLGKFILSFDDITALHFSEAVLIDNFEIFQEPYKKEVIVHFNEVGMTTLKRFFPEELIDRANKNYKVTVEEIEVIEDNE